MQLVVERPALHCDITIRYQAAAYCILVSVNYNEAIQVLHHYHYFRKEVTEIHLAGNKMCIEAPEGFLAFQQSPCCLVHSTLKTGSSTLFIVL